MGEVHIDRGRGTITLPSGEEIDPGLTQEAFRSSQMFPRSQCRDYGTPPWIHFLFSGGRLGSKDLLVSVCFYDQVLVYVDLMADLYPPGAKDWSSYSLEVERKTKKFHDRLLEKLLGKPTKTRSAPDPLSRAIEWRFPWGRIVSGHDSKGGDTSITISYGDRNAEANRAFGRGVRR